MSKVEQLEELINGLSAEGAPARGQAAQQLARLEPTARPAAVPLVRACADNETVREWAVAALEGLGPPDPEDVAVLAELLGDDCVEVAFWAATLLGRLGTEARKAVPALASAVSAGAGIATRQRAAWALGQIGPAAAAALDCLQQAAASPDAHLASVARQTIGQITG